MSKAEKEKLVIYLADLEYFGPGNRISIPLGIGSIASYAKSFYGDKIDISLFKDPDKLMASIRKRPPHVLGCSFFMWNTNLTFKVIEACKIINQKTITIIGGPNVARITDRYQDFLKIHPSLDIVVLDQGEKTFANILDRILKNGLNQKSIFKNSIDGCAIRLNGNGPVKRGKVIQRSIDINSFPSPYLMGYFDEFLSAGFAPNFETARGCPHRCTYCSGGINSFLPISFKDEKVVYEELLYIYKHSIIKDLDIADTNFGINGERDLRISAFMVDLYKKTGFPRITGYATTKHKTKASVELMVNISRLTGSLYFALQTLTPDVLKKCRRKNIPFDMIEELVAISKKNNWPINVDMIFGLPGETFDSFMETFDKLLALGIEAPNVYQLRTLPGTIIAEQERQQYGYKTKFRPITSHYGEYSFIPGGKPVRIIEPEEIACGSNSFSLDDFLAMRIFGFITMLMVGRGAFADTVFYLSSRGIKFTEIFKIILKKYKDYPRLQALLEDYKKYSHNELFDSEEELINEITSDDKLWKDLLNGEGTFFKLDQGFTGYSLFEDVGILEDIKKLIIKGVKNKLSAKDRKNLNEVIKRDKLYRIIHDKPVGKLTVDDVHKEIIVDEKFNYEKWRDENFKGSINNYRLDKEISIVYYIEKFDFLNEKIKEFSCFSGLVFYEKIISWGPDSIKRLSYKK